MSTTDLRGVLDVLDERRRAGTRVVDEPTSKQILQRVGLTVPSGEIAGTADDAVVAATAVGYPCAVKLVADDLPHKSESGAVAGPLTTSDEVRTAAASMLRLPSVESRGVLVESWLQDGVETLLSLSFHEPYGPLLTFGVGGIWVEAHRDVVHRLAPVDIREATELVHGIRSAAVLTGGRGRPPVDVEGLAETIRLLGELALDAVVTEQVAEIEINPLLARPKGPATALDAMVVR